MNPEHCPCGYRPEVCPWCAAPDDGPADDRATNDDAPWRDEWHG